MTFNAHFRTCSVSSFKRGSLVAVFLVFLVIKHHRSIRTTKMLGSDRYIEPVICILDEKMQRMQKIIRSGSPYFWYWMIYVPAPFIRKPLHNQRAFDRARRRWMSNVFMPSWQLINCNFPPLNLALDTKIEKIDCHNLSIRNMLEHFLSSFPASLASATVIYCTDAESCQSKYHTYLH